MSVDLHSEDDLRAAIAEVADAETPDLSRVLLHRTEPAHRHNRLAPIAAAVTVLVVAAVVLVVTHVRTRHDADQLAVGPTEATAAQPCRSTTTPPFDTFVLSGIRTVGTVTCSGYRLQYVQADTVNSVTLYRPGLFSLSRLSQRQRVSTGPVTGWIGAVRGEPAQPCKTSDPRQTTLRVSCRSTAFVWRYAPHAWGVVASSLSSPRAALLRIAGAVRLRAVPLRFPAHLSYVPAGLHVSRASSYTDPPQALDNGVTGADLQLSRGGTVFYDIAVESRAHWAGYGRGLAPVPVRIGDDFADVDANHRTAAMRHDNCELTIVAKQQTAQSEFVRILRGARFFDCTRPSTWPTANDAVSG